MNLKKIYILYFFILTFIYKPNKVIGQNDPFALKKTRCDCNLAISIIISQKTSYGLTYPPKGFGKIQEIKAKNKNDIFSFEMEHNSAWYILDIERDGELVMDIIPNDITNDYDFLLYKYTDTLFCKNLLEGKVFPIRGNLSKNNIKTNGSTGISSSAKNDFIAKGTGEAYSKSVDVKKGEKYMLVLDNIVLAPSKVGQNFGKRKGLTKFTGNETKKKIYTRGTFINSSGIRARRLNSNVSQV